MEIQYLSHNEIDKQKWDFCIKNSYNTTIQAFSWYLDTVCESWDALVQNDYLKVMPLPFQKKYSYNIITPPPFIHNLGVFSIGKLNAEMIEEFFQAIPRKFRYFEIPLSRFNRIHSQDFHISKTYSYALDLISPYPDLHNKFGNDFLEKISIAESHKLKIQRKIPVIDFLTLYVSNHATDVDSKKEEKTNTLKTLLNLLTRHAVADIRGVTSNSGELLCACVLISYINNVSFLLLEISDSGEKYHADALLIDECIREFSGRNIVVDFVALNTYKNIDLLKEVTAYLTEFVTVRKNNLPWLVKKLKQSKR